ncbi:hypothetical protein C6361_27495 [Plantactinospora sp. BC1]|uniref:hypothetical protein n=1 Tax=Plantactinospora sp. BC1 TaxID=2108470 RepID=UPI000D159931|nr:hypothetical protein [Plantactinospora sp. BC1]AVT32589.1 hypothetical protein C6361_27495 [Plantactinospora sp. BC1]
MTIWDDLGPEERVILQNAVEEAWLNNVIGDYLGHAEHGGLVWMISSDEDAIRPLVPRFAAIVKDMVRRDLIALIHTARHHDVANAPYMTDNEIDAALIDPDTWFPPTGAGPVMLITTDHTDRLLGRQQP